MAKTEGGSHKFCNALFGCWFKALNFNSFNVSSWMHLVQLPVDLDNLDYLIFNASMIEIDLSPE